MFFPSEITLQTVEQGYHILYVLYGFPIGMGILFIIGIPSSCSEIILNLSVTLIPTNHCSY